MNVGWLASRSSICDSSALKRRRIIGILREHAAPVPRLAFSNPEALAQCIPHYFDMVPKSWRFWDSVYIPGTYESSFRPHFDFSCFGHFLYIFSSYNCSDNAYSGAMRYAHNGHFARVPRWFSAEPYAVWELCSIATCIMRMGTLSVFDSIQQFFQGHLY